MAQFKKEFKSVDGAILDQAARSFRHSERVRSALHFLKDNPQEFKVRSEQLEGKKIPQLFDLSLQRQLKKLTGKGDATIVDGIDQSFAEVGSWTWPDEVTDDTQLASGVLIEGFGYLLEKLAGKEDVKRNFVLGFEEVGVINFPNISIMEDIKPWLIEESKEFSPGAQQAIDKLIPVTV